ncbi:hypothetical protein D3C87_1428350 [compost metagenome]
MSVQSAPTMPTPSMMQSREVLDRAANTSRKQSRMVSSGVFHRLSSDAAQAAAAVPPAAMTIPIWFFSYQMPRHIPALTS